MFAAALLMHRERLGLTQAGAASFLGMPLRTWEDYEAGRREPPEWVQKLVLRVLSGGGGGRKRRAK